MASVNYKASSNPNKKAKLNASHCPPNMSLQQWQRALRRQAAENEVFRIQANQIVGKPFIVRSGASGRVYNVHYYGESSEFNRCDCMDFKTSRLGTCKHIEAISIAHNGRYANIRYRLPYHSSVYVDYPDGRKIKIRIGLNNHEEMQRLAPALFDKNKELKDITCDPSAFIREARRLDPDFEWEPDALNLLIENRDKARRNLILKQKYESSDLSGLLKTSLHPYQLEGVKFAFAQGRSINADEMGLGKTVQAIATAELLKREGLISSVIVVCPTSLKYQWAAEIKRFTDSPAIVIEGNIVRRRKQFNNPSFFYKICSFNALSNSIKAQMIPEADMIIYDELQRLKNKDTQMGKQLRKLQSQYVMALSGTPLENKLDELYSVTQLVDQFILGPYYKFTSETTLKDNTGKILGYKNLHQVADKLSDTLIRRRKSEVRLQMPERTDTILYVPMTNEQRAIHEEYKLQVASLIHKWRKFSFLSEPDRKRLMLFLSMMRMVCDSTFILDQKSRYDTKIDEVKAIISNMMEQNDSKVVIFSQWERMLRILATELTASGIDFCFLHGAVPSAKRKDLIDRFRDDADCRIFLSTDAGATGLNLQSASLLINLDLPWNPALLEQRIARIYRLGQQNPVQVISMVAKDTIEERMLSTLNFKSNLAAGILDGGEDAVFLDNNKFNKIIETVEGVISTPQPGDELSRNAPSETRPAERVYDNAEKPKETPANPHESRNISHESQNKQQEHPDNHQESPCNPHSASTHNDSKPDSIRGIVTDGISALSKFADLLRDPDSVKVLADTLVKEDPDTGQTSLNIPVPDKSTVVNILSAFSALLNKSK